MEKTTVFLVALIIILAAFLNLAFGVGLAILFIVAWGILKKFFQGKS